MFTIICKPKKSRAVKNSRFFKIQMPSKIQGKNVDISNQTVSRKSQGNYKTYTCVIFWFNLFSVYADLGKNKTQLKE